jgi:hypothetical protein
MRSGLRANEENLSLQIPTIQAEIEGEKKNSSIGANVGRSEILNVEVAAPLARSPSVGVGRASDQMGVPSVYVAKLAGKSLTCPVFFFSLLRNLTSRSSSRAGKRSAVVHITKAFPNFNPLHPGFYMPALGMTGAALDTTEEMHSVARSSMPNNYLHG